MENILKQLNYQPIDISTDRLDDPSAGIIYFFETHSLQEARANLWKLYKGWIYLASVMDSVDELTDMLFFYNQMVELVQFCYVFKERNDDKE